MGNPVQVRALSNAPSEYNGLLLPERKRRDRFLRSAKGIMNPSFKPYRTGMLTVKEKYSCGCGDGHKGRNHVYYLCQCDCGREVIFSGDEISHHPYSCGCTPKPLEKRKESLASVIGHGIMKEHRHRARHVAQRH